MALEWSIVSKKMKLPGIKDAYCLEGAIFQWANEKKPLVDANGLPTKKVHAFTPKLAKYITDPDAVYLPKSDEEELKI